MRRNKFNLFILLPSLFLFGCTERDNVYTLYRNSVFDENARVHVSTFDADESAEYNQINCKTAQELFGSQKGIKTRFFCEKGSFKK